MFLLPPGILTFPVLGIAGGISIGVANFGISCGSSVPPGIGSAYARGTVSCHGTFHGASMAAHAIALILKNRRLVIIVCLLRERPYRLLLPPPAHLLAL